MNKYQSFVVATIQFLSFLGKSVYGQSIQASKPEIRPYVDYIKVNAKELIDYIVSLFDEFDVVVIAERDHRETTQWDFIYLLVSDPIFIKKVGFLFTEYGSVTQQDELDVFLNSKIIEEIRILNILRNFILWPEG